MIKVKESLPHGEWGKWLEEKVDFSPSTAKRFIRVATEFGNSNVTSLLHLESTKIFALLDLPPEERTDFVSQTHEIKGEVKTVDEMSTREFQQAIKDKKH